MSQDQIDQQMQRLMQALEAGKITGQEFEAHLEALRDALIVAEDATSRALATIRKLLTEEEGA